MKDKKVAAGAGAGVVVIGLALAAGLGAKKAVAEAPPEEKTAAEIHKEEIEARAKEIKVIADTQIQTGEKTPGQIYDEIDYVRQQLINEAVIRTNDIQLATIHPGMTMDQVDEITKNIYAETGADDILDENHAYALAQKKIQYQEATGKTSEQVEQRAFTGEYAYPGGYWDWYHDHFQTTKAEREALGIS
ncbi:hypothetical protein ES705_14612 [subsurface metagenome]